MYTYERPSLSLSNLVDFLLMLYLSLSEQGLYKKMIVEKFTEKPGI